MCWGQQAEVGGGAGTAATALAGYEAIDPKSLRTGLSCQLCVFPTVGSPARSSNTVDSITSCGFACVGNLNTHSWQLSIVPRCQ
jgi:hypothetical protein